MSLVSEALRKARAEHQRRALESGQLPPAVAPVPRTAPTRYLPIVLAASVLSGMLGASVAVFLWRSSVPAPPAPNRPLHPPDPTPATTSPPTPPPTASQIFVASQNEPPAVRPAGTPAPPAPAYPTPTPVPAPPASTPAPAASPPQEFVLEATLGATTLRLDYLVYGPGRAFARINGQEVTEGSLVEGFTVAAIAEDRVILRRGDRTIVLKLR